MSKRLQKVTTHYDIPLSVACEVLVGRHCKFDSFVFFRECVVEYRLELIARRPRVIFVGEEAGGLGQPVDCCAGKSARIHGRQPVEIIPLQKAMANFHKKRTQFPPETQSPSY